MKTAIEYLSDETGKSKERLEIAYQAGNVEFISVSEYVKAMEQCKSDAVKDAVMFTVEEIHGRESYQQESNEQLTELFLKRLNERKS